VKEEHTTERLCRDEHVAGTRLWLLLGLSGPLSSHHGLGQGGSKNEW
jgi:hypothetical protein